jgi:hypothetical protein
MATEFEGELVEYLKDPHASRPNVDQVLDAMIDATEDPEIRGQLERLRIGPILREHSQARRSQFGSTLLGRRHGH